MLNARDIERLSDECIGESVELEYKRELTRDKAEFLKDVTAMANVHGGHIIVGVDEGLLDTLCGVENAQQNRERLMDWCVGSITPALDLSVSVVDVKGYDVLVLEVPDGPEKPYSYSHHGRPQFKKRVGDRIRDLRYDEIKELTLLHSKPAQTTVRATQSNDPSSQDPRIDFVNAKSADNPLGLKFNILKFEETLSHEGPSLVAKYSFDSDYFVIKKTPREICDLDAIRKVERIEAIGLSWRVESKVASPIEVLEVGDNVYELHVHVDGISLDRLVVNNRFRIVGDFLGATFNSIVNALNELHRQGLVHRDIRPQNIFLLGDGTLLVLDSTSVARQGTESFALDIGAFTAPEQLEFRSSVMSDWYSLASTVCFMAEGKVSTKPSGLRLDLGAFSQKQLIECLEADAERRPQKLVDVLLREHSRIAIRNATVEAILDADQLGFLVIEASGYRIVKKEGFNDYLSSAKTTDAELKNAIEQHLSGNPMWQS